MDVQNAIIKVRGAIAKHSPEILTGIGVAGMIATTIMAVKATPKALKLCEELRNERRNEYDEDPTKLEYVKVAWKCYIPATVTGVTSIVCLIGASSVNIRRNAALTTAYSLSETALREYREKVRESVGEKKEKEIRKSVAQEKIEKNPVKNNNVIITDRGDTLCYDMQFGRYFKSDIDTIKRAINEINRKIVCDMYASLNDFYDEIGLSHVKVGDDIGWNLDDKTIDIEFTSHLAEDGTPCLAINYSASPKHGYSSFL